MVNICSKQFTLAVTEGVTTYYNLQAHTAYGWCDADPESVLEVTTAIGAASSVISQEDAEAEACAQARAILITTQLPALCGGGGFTLSPGCNVPPVVTYYSIEVAAYFFPPCFNAVATCTDGTNDGQTFNVSGVSAGAYTSLISQEDADNQAYDAFAAANAGQQAFEDACSAGGGYTVPTCA